MSILSAFLGHASEADSQDTEQQLQKLLLPQEEVTRAYKLIRDLFVFTNKRLILVNKQGITGKKIEYQSIPYKHISRFSIQTAGTIDFDTELFIYLIGEPNPIIQEFKNDGNMVYQIQTTLAHYVLG